MVSRITEDRLAVLLNGQRPLITMQPTVMLNAGTPLGIVIAEIVCPESDESGLFAGLGAFVRAELPDDKGATDIALEKLVRELQRKGRKLGADAIVSANIKLLRGMHAAGHKLIKMTGTGTAVALPERQD